MKLEGSSLDSLLQRPEYLHAVMNRLTIIGLAVASLAFLAVGGKREHGATETQPAGGSGAAGQAN